MCILEKSKFIKKIMKFVMEIELQESEVNVKVY